MKLNELKQKLNELPPEMDDCEVIFGEGALGMPLENIEVVGYNIELSFF